MLLQTPDTGPPQLPPEVWCQVFSYLPVRDLCQVLLVAKQWRDLASSTASLWTRVGVNKKKLLEEGFPGLVAVPRLRNILHFDLSDLWCGRRGWEGILTHLVHYHGSLASLDISGADLGGVEAELVVAALRRARLVNISRLEPGVTAEILARLAEAGPGNIRQLRLSGDLTEVPPGDLCSLARVARVTLGPGTSLTDQQFLGLVSRCHASGTQLEAAATVTAPALPLASALTQLHGTRLQLQLGSSDLATQDWRLALGCLAAGRSRLRHLDILAPFQGINLQHLDPDLISAAFSRLVSLGLQDVVLTEAQWTAILKTAASLSELDLRMINLTSVEAGLLAQRLASCDRLSLDYVAMTQPQWLGLLQAAATSRLRHLRISNADLSKLPSPLLMSVVARCSTLDLSSSSLAPAQLEDLLRLVPSCTWLTSLDLHSCDLSAAPEAVLARAVVSLASVSLRKTRLSCGQATAVLAAIVMAGARSRLRHLDLSYVRLGGVCGELVALGLSRLATAQLFCCLLTRDQLQRLAHQLCHGFSRLERLTLQSTSANLLPYETRKELRNKLLFEILT